MGFLPYILRIPVSGYFFPGTSIGKGSKPHLWNLQNLGAVPPFGPSRFAVFALPRGAVLVLVMS